MPADMTELSVSIDIDPDPVDDAIDRLVDDVLKVGQRCPECRYRGVNPGFFFEEGVYEDGRVHALVEAVCPSCDWEYSLRTSTTVTITVGDGDD